MPDDLRLNVVGDVTQLSAPMKEGADVVVDSTDRMSKAMAAYQAVAEKGGASSKALGVAFDQAKAGGASFVAAMEQAVAATNAQTAASQRLTVEQRRQVEEYVTAQREEAAAAKAAAAEEAAAAREAARVASIEQRRQYEEYLAQQESMAHATVTGQQAVSAAIRGGGIRAEEQFLAKTLGLGPILQTAFPVIGLLAFGEQAVRAGEYLYNAFDLGGKRARQTEDDIRGVTMELDRSSTSLDVQIDKLQQEQAKLEKKPFNGMKLVFDEDIERAQQLIEKLDQVIEREMKVVAGMAASTPQQIFSGGSNTKYEQTMLREHSKWLDQAKTSQDALNESKSFGASLQVRLNELLGKQRDNEQAQRGANTMGAGGAPLTTYKEEIQAVQELIAWNQREQDQVSKTMTRDTLAGTVQGDKDKNAAARYAKAGDRDADRAAREQLKAIQAQFEEQSAAESSVKGHGMTAGEGASFWAQYLTTFKQGSTEATTVLKEFVKYQDDIHKQIAEGMKKVAAAHGPTAAEDEALQRSFQKYHELQQIAIDDNNRAGERWANYNAQVAKGAEIQAQAAAALEEEQIRIALANGTITAQGAAMAEAGIHTADYTAKLKALQAQLDALRATGATLKPGDKGYEQNATQQQGVQNQMAQLGGQQTVTKAADAAAISQSISQPYIRGMDAINSSWLNVQNQLIRGTRSISAAFANMGVNILESVAGNFEKMVFKALESEVRMTIAHQTATTTRVATDAAGAATSDSISAVSALKQQAHSAAVAAGKAWSAFADIPIVGPVLGAAAAAATYAGVMALAAFETGGIVPKTGIVMAHEKEGILPRNLTEFLLKAANDKTSGGAAPGGNSSSFSQTNNYAGITDRDHRAKTLAHSDTVFSAWSREMRRQGMA